jgi:hypothetical protein
MMFVIFIFTNIFLPLWPSYGSLTMHLTIFVFPNVFTIIFHT